MYMDGSSKFNIQFNNNINIGQNNISILYLVRNKTKEYTKDIMYIKQDGTRSKKSKLFSTFSWNWLLISATHINSSFLLKVFN